MADCSHAASAAMVQLGSDPHRPTSRVSYGARLVMDIVIRRVRIDDERPLVDIGIEAGRIVEIAEQIPETAVEEIDAAGRAALPGFVEPHLHLDKAFLHRRLPARTGTLEEAIRVTGILKAKQERDDVLERSRRVLDMAIRNGTTLIRAHPDVDPIQGLVGVETALELREEYRDLIDIQIVAFPQEGILKTAGVVELMDQALDAGADVVGGCPYNESHARRYAQPYRPRL
ncbi:amidohydrolase family protein [Methylobacterium sp. P31]